MWPSYPHRDACDGSRSGPSSTGSRELQIEENLHGTGSAPDTEAPLRLLLEFAPVALAMFDRQMRYLAVSARWLADYGLQEKDVLGRSHYDVFPEIPERWRAIHRSAMQGSFERMEEDPFVRADGVTQWLRWEVRPWRDAGGRIGGIVIFTEDITARTQARQEQERTQLEVARRSQQLKIDGLFRDLLESAPDAMVVVDSAGRIVLANSQAESLFGYTRRELLGQPHEMLMPERLRGSHAAHRAGYLEGPRIRKMGSSPEMIALRKDGSEFPVEISLSPLQTGEGILVSTVIRDITERKMLQKKLEEEARTDPVTGVATRRYLMELAQREFMRVRRHGGAMSVVTVDLDNFKQVNDRFGHAAGDDVLRALAQNCRAALREEDVIGRMGGDEFAILLPETDIGRAAIVGERLRDGIGGVELAVGAASPLRVTASIGVATLAVGDQTLASLLQRADEAMYEAKRAGRDTVRGQ